jgi:hypothetical protein
MIYTIINAKKHTEKRKVKEEKFGGSSQLDAQEGSPSPPHNPKLHVVI